MQRESLRYPSCPCFGRWSVSGVRDTVFPITTGYLLSIGNEHVWLGWFEILIFRNIQTSTVQRSHLDISFIHLISSHLISSHLISSHLISSHLISSHLISSHLISSHLISSHLISSHLISSHLISSHLISSHLTVCHGSAAEPLQSTLFNTTHSSCSNFAAMHSWDDASLTRAGHTSAPVAHDQHLPTFCL